MAADTVNTTISYDFSNIVQTNIPLRFKETWLISIFITLIAGLHDHIVKNTRKHW
jgi:hypothetical protein